MNEASQQKFIRAFETAIGSLIGLIAGIALIAGFMAGRGRFTAMVLPTILSLIFLLLWGRAWSRRPVLAFGMFFGLAGACVAVSLASIFALSHLPIWLPALPFAATAIMLLSFGILAWRWGTKT